VGPLLLFYGFRVKKILLVLNSLISSGINSVLESIAYVEMLSAGISEGRLMPEQLAELLSVLLGAFMLSAAAPKIKKLNTAMKGGVVANLVFSIVAYQIPPPSSIAFATLAATPIQSHAVRLHGGSCTSSRGTLLRRQMAALLHIKYSCVLFCSYMATHAANFVDRLNSSMVAANLLNEAIFDTTLAAFPGCGSRMQPFRISALLFMSSVGVFVQGILEKLSDPAETDPHTFCLGCFKFFNFNKTSTCLMAPLLLLSSSIKGMLDASWKRGESDRRQRQANGESSAAECAGAVEDWRGAALALRHEQPGDGLGGHDYVSGYRATNYGRTEGASSAQSRCCCSSWSIAFSFCSVWWR
jgi:hypothetical protein